MIKKLKMILISVILICSIYNFSYATEEDGRFVDIPVPPASSGRADFTSEEGQEQAKQYEENKSIFQTNSEVLEENFILYKGTDETDNNVTEENIINNEENQIQNENYSKDENITTNITLNQNNKTVLFIICIIFLIIIVAIIKKIMYKNKRK